jgi:hypothetical protein
MMPPYWFWNFFHDSRACKEDKNKSAVNSGQICPVIVRPRPNEGHQESCRQITKFLPVFCLVSVHGLIEELGGRTLVYPTVQYQRHSRDISRQKAG